jgi:hypothetical protein
MARLSAILVVVAWCAPALADDAAFFEKSVRPVLVEKCLSCHSAAKAKSGLRLDIREMLLKGGEGGAAIVPGKPTESRLIAAVKQSGDLKMPPAGKLPEREIAALEEWVRRGAAG